MQQKRKKVFWDEDEKAQLAGACVFISDRSAATREVALINIAQQRLNWPESRRRKIRSLQDVPWLYPAMEKVREEIAEKALETEIAFEDAKRRIVALENTVVDSQRLIASLKTELVEAKKQSVANLSSEQLAQLSAQAMRRELRQEMMPVVAPVAAPAPVKPAPVATPARSNPAPAVKPRIVLVGVKPEQAQNMQAHLPNITLITANGGTAPLAHGVVYTRFVEDSDVNWCRRHYGTSLQCLVGGQHTWIEACREMASGKGKGKHRIYRPDGRCQEVTNAK